MNEWLTERSTEKDNALENLLDDDLLVTKFQSVPYIVDYI